MNKPNQYDVHDDMVTIHEVLPVLTTDKPFKHKHELTRYENDQLITYLSDEDDVDAEPTTYTAFDADFIKTDILGETDDNWKDKYQTNIQPEDVDVSRVLLMSSDRITRHQNGEEPLTWKELHRHCAVRMRVRLHPRKKPRASAEMRKLRRQMRDLKEKAVHAASLLKK